MVGGKKQTNNKKRGISRNLYLVNSEIMEYLFNGTLGRATPCQSHSALTPECTVPCTPIMLYRQEIKIQSVFEKSFTSS